MIALILIGGEGSTRSRKKSTGGGSGGAGIVGRIGNMKISEGSFKKSGRSGGGSGGGRKSWVEEGEVNEKCSGSVKSKPDLQAIIRTQASFMIFHTPPRDDAYTTGSNYLLNLET